MLVLSRQINESIMIGDSIEVTIVDIKGDKVRIGIAAPRNVAVHRKEVYLAIQQENLAAAQAGGVDTLGDLGNLFGGSGSDPFGGGKA
jgi:carbon storage regulator